MRELTLPSAILKKECCSDKLFLKEARGEEGFEVGRSRHLLE